MRDRAALGQAAHQHRVLDRDGRGRNARAVLQIGRAGVRHAVGAPPTERTSAAAAPISAAMRGRVAAVVRTLAIGLAGQAAVGHVLVEGTSNSTMRPFTSAARALSSSKLAPRSPGAVRPAAGVAPEPPSAVSTTRWLTPAGRPRYSTSFAGLDAAHPVRHLDRLQRHLGAQLAHRLGHLGHGRRRAGEPDRRGPIRSVMSSRRSQA
jgi:hypothetical protein